MAEMVEHQATVDTGLKMKIKRKNPASSSKSCDAKRKTDDKNGNLKNRKSRPDSNSVDAVISSPTADDKTSAENFVEFDDQTQKRRRNNVRQTKIIPTGDFARDTKSNRSESEPQKTNNNSTNVSKEKTKTGKSVSPPTKPIATEKPTRKRLAQNNMSLPCSGSACELAKSKNARIITVASERETADDKIIELRKPGHGLNKIETDGSIGPQRKSDLTLQDGTAPANPDSLSDPYEFIAKVEDTIETPVKKFKSDKADGADQPFGTGTDHQDVSTETCTVGVTTDPDFLGPCEPGTSVILEGIVWSESNNGILVVNVTWRGKTYVGTLMDSTKHNWASPRFCDDSPEPDLDWRLPKTKRPCGGSTPVAAEVLEGRRLRKCRRNANGCTNSKPASRQSPVYNEANLGRRRGGKPLEHPESNSQVPPDSRRSGEGPPETGDNLLECSSSNCRKKFKHVSGLSYHQSHAHGKSVSEPSFKSVAVEDTAASVDDNSEICPVAPDEIVTENNEDFTADKEPGQNVGHIFRSGVRDSVAADTSEKTVEFPAVASQTIITSSMVSTLSASVEKVENSISNLPQLAGDAFEDSKLIAGGTESCVKNQDVCCKVSDDKEKDAVSPASRSSDPEKVDSVEEGEIDSGDLLISRHFSNSSVLQTLHLVNATRDSDSNAVDGANHVVSSSESLAVEITGNSSRSEGNSDEKSSTYSDISENNDELDSKSAKLHIKDAKLKMQASQSEARHRSNTKPETSASLHNMSSARPLHHSHGTSILLQNSTAVEPDSSKNTESNSFVGLQQQPEDKTGQMLGPANTDSSRLRDEGTGQEFANSRHTTTAVGPKMAPVVTSAVPYSYGHDYSAYHVQFFAQNPESRNQYERWLMEHGHNYIHQQQRCFNKSMQVEADVCLASQAEPVDMSSKGHSNTDRPSLSPRTRLSEQSMVKSAENNRPQGKPTGKDWLPPPTNHRNLPRANFGDWTGLGSSGASGLKEGPRHDQKHKDSTCKLPCVNLGQGQRSLDHNASPSRPQNPIGAAAPYSSDSKQGYVPRHASLIGASYAGVGGVSYVDWPDCNSPNTKLLDLDSKEVVSSCDRHRSRGEARRALDMFRGQDAAHPPGGKDATPGGSQRESAADHSSSLTLCHLHTHHHTHLVGAAYHPIYGSYNGLMSSVPAMVSPVPSVIPQTYLPK